MPLPYSISQWLIPFRKKQIWCIRSNPANSDHMYFRPQKVRRDERRSQKGVCVWKLKYREKLTGETSSARFI